MRTVSIFKNGKSQAVRLPADMAYEGIRELEITREGDVITLRPVRPSWTSLHDLPKAMTTSCKNGQPSWAMKVGSICDDLHARYMYLLIHHA